MIKQQAKALEVDQERIKTSNMDHHGLVAAICKDLKIAERIDKRLLANPNRRVSPGQAVVAMIINGLGYTNRPLYLSHHFFSSKPIGSLIDRKLEAKDITDYTLAHALDDIAAYGSAKLFMEIAMEIALEHNLLGSLNHLDTNSFALEGDYATQEKDQVMTITHGYSKDHRPDLKQVVLSLVVNGPSGIPICMEALSGNSSDKESFHRTISQVEEFKKQIDIENPFRWVADSALYTRDKLLKYNNFTWLTSVPGTLKESKELLEKPEENIVWKDQGDGYKTSSYSSKYKGSEQRLLLVHSAKSYEREKKTLENKLEREKKALKQSLWHLSKEVFSSKANAKKH